MEYLINSNVIQLISSQPPYAFVYVCLIKSFKRNNSVNQDLKDFILLAFTYKYFFF